MTPTTTEREIKRRPRAIPSKRAVQDENVALRRLCHRMIDLLALKMDPRFPVTAHDRNLLEDMRLKLDAISNTTEA